MPPDQRAPIKILITAANPADRTRLFVEREICAIHEGVAADSERFKITSLLDTRPEQLRKILLRTRPQFLHFSGHGGFGGIAFEDGKGGTQIVTSEAIANLIKLFSDTVQVVLLNCCYSKGLARNLVQVVDYVIGMDGAIGDDAAITFSSGFYDALGEGMDIEFAYAYARSAVQIEFSDKSEHVLPCLLKRKKYHSAPTDKPEIHQEVARHSVWAPRRRSADNAPKRDGLLPYTQSAVTRFFNVSTSRQTCCTWSYDNKLIVCAGFDGCANILDPQKSEITVVSLGRGTIQRTLLSWQRSVLIGDDSGRVVSLDLQTQEHTTIANIQSPIFHLARGRTPDSLLIAEGSGKVSEWKLSTPLKGPPSASFLAKISEHVGKAFAAEFDSFSGRFITGGSDGQVHIIDPRAIAPKTINLGRFSVFSLAVHPSKSMIACGTADGTIHVIDYDFNVVSTEIHVDTTRSLSFSPMGTWLASGSKDKHIKLWRPESGRVLILAKANDYVYEVRFSHDGRLVMAADGAGVLTVVDFGQHVDLAGQDDIERVLKEAE